MTLYTVAVYLGPYFKEEQFDFRSYSEAKAWGFSFAAGYDKFIIYNNNKTGEQQTWIKNYQETGTWKTLDPQV
jgi:hypothetical protein